MIPNQPFVWWQRGVIYQIYPRSFMDSNGDGVGDLRGIRERLDYLVWLGVDAIWISPIFASPMADFGYDISDYRAIDPVFGTMRDFDELLTAAHDRGLKVILDFVPNHSSDQHEWFQESRSSRNSPQRDWYLWRDPAADGGPPNNWLSVFGGSAWEFDEQTRQYYYHAFLKEQPDLNWWHPQVERAMLETMEFWLGKGVDGFRVDVMWHLIKDPEYRDNPPNPDYRADAEPPYHQIIPAYSTDQPQVHDVVARMRKVVDRYEQRVIIGEVYLPVSQLVRYYGEDGTGAHLPFNFQLVVLPWRADEIYAAITEYEATLPPFGWPNWVLGNHDQSRIATRVGLPQARVAALLLLTLRGTPTLYYGDELGMVDVPIEPAQYKDPQGINIGISRDPQRTPMQWDGSRNAGFSEATPWLPVAPNAAQVNVESQRDDPDSMLSFYRRLLALRRGEPALEIGDYAPAGLQENGFAFLRERADRRFLIVLNLGDSPIEFVPQLPGVQGTIVFGTNRHREGGTVEGSVQLDGDEAVVIALHADATT